MSSVAARRLGRFVIVAVVALGLAGCGSGDTSSADGTTVDNGFGDPGNCTVVDIAISSEKVDLMKELATDFNSQRNIVDGACVFVRPQTKASGAAATTLANGWDTAVDGPQPVIWSPASSAWGPIVNQRLADQGKPALAPSDATPFMLTPLVIAMPKPMADALGYPAKPVGYADLAKLATSPNGWADYGHPEWGAFRLGKTNPNFSTSGLSALIAQTYAAAGKTEGLSTEDLSNPAVIAQSKAIESSVVHYGDITMTFLNNWFRADKRGTALTYASAVAVEEKSLIDYNLGNPDGILDPGEVARPPKIPLVAIYPSEGTLYSDNPFFVLDAPWVSTPQRAGAAKFQEYVQTPENQAKVLKFGFRPGNPTVAVSDPITAANGVNPEPPATLLRVPAPRVMVDLLDKWQQFRKGARVLVVLDVSGSMGDDAGNGTETKLELAKSAAIAALDQFVDTDLVGLRIFSTNLGPQQDQQWLDLLPVEAIGPQREKIRSAIGNLVPTNGTPLFDVTQNSYQTMLDGYDPTRINAVILLTDGQNDDGNRDDDATQRETLINGLRTASASENARPVRIFTVAYGSDADKESLKAIAEASNAAAYTATDAKTIAKVLAQVVSNF